jgi:hypothetical protein
MEVVRMKKLFISITLGLLILNFPHVETCQYMDSKQSNIEYIVNVKTSTGCVYSYYSYDKDHPQAIKCYFLGGNLVNTEE